MNKVTFPLNPNSSGPVLTDLQAALLVMVERGIYPINEEERQFFLTILREEQAANRYSDGTNKLVGMLQEIRHLPFSGEVDEPTARTINELLAEWGLLDQGGAPPLQIVSGQLRREGGAPWPGLRVQVLQLVEQGSIRLGEDTSDGEGRYTIRYQPLLDMADVLLQVACFDSSGQRRQESDKFSASSPLLVIDLVVPTPVAPAPPSAVTGRILMEYGAPAANLALRLYHRGFGDQVTAVAEATTDADGRYTLTYDLNTANLEVRAVVGETEVPLSNTLFRAAKTTTLNLIAPTTAQPVAESEFARLGAALTAQLGDLSLLTSAEEKGDRQDITYLSNATDWDARPIALAALAGNLGEQVGIAHEAAYALVRSGLPADLDQLVQVDKADVSLALENAAKAGVISLDEGQRLAALNQVMAVATTKRLATKAVGALSTFGDFMAQAGLDATQQQQFADLYFSQRQTGEELWSQAAAAGLPVDQLKVQGKLALLTANNAPLTQTLQAGIATEEDLPRLVDAGLYEAAAWHQRLSTLAGVAEDDDNAAALAALIPPAYQGATLAERKAAYCRDMAAMVEAAFPEQVQRHLLTSDKLALPPQYTQIKGEIDTVWQRAAGLGFQLGAVQSEAFFNRFRDQLFPDISNETEQSTRELFTWFQRIYQTTPSRTAMQIVLKLGHDSANSIAEIDEDRFVERFVEEYLAEFKRAKVEEARDLARLTYYKAQQVTATTHNVVAALQQVQSTPAVAVISGSAQDRQAEQAALQAKLAAVLPGFPHLAELFGPLDWGECDHCHSVLSPAAYLVDLLQFLDRAEGDWRYFTDKWRKDHGEEYSARYSKPYDALIARRPDLIHLPLTCENTHTALPYIDIVNEILEYYLVHNQLSEEVAHDTGAATTPELLAEPQYIEPAAYTLLKEAQYPLTLPFDLWLETVRQLCDHLGMPLAQVIATLQPVTNDDFTPDFAAERARLIESLGISPAEAAILTDEDPLPKLAARYGYGDEATMAAEIGMAKELAARLGVSYKELVALLRTHFINPKLAELQLLHNLGVSIVDLMRYQGADGFAPFTALEQATFAERLSQVGATYGIDAATELATLWTNGVPQQALLLNDSAPGSSLATATVGYAAAPATPFDWLKLQLLVRLWRRLGWQLEEVDQALRVCLPANLQALMHDPTQPEAVRAQALGQGFASALINLAHLQALSSALAVGKQARLKLTTLWGALPTRGTPSLYAQLFLSRNVLKIDGVFDHALGNYLADPNVPLAAHQVAVQAALGLTAPEIELICQDAANQLDKVPVDPSQVALTLANLSLLYRYGLLAKGLKLPVADMITLKGLTGLNPFAPLATDAIVDGAGDQMGGQTLTFVTWAALLKASPFTLVDLAYLFRHDFDPTGDYRNAASNAATFVTTLAQAIDQIQRDHAIPTNPADPADLTPFAALTDELLQQKLALVLPAAALERFFAMWTGRQPADWTLVGEAVIPFLTEESFTSLFSADEAGADIPTQQLNALTKRATLGRALLTYVQQGLTQQAIVRTLSESLQADAGLLEWLISDAPRLHLPTTPDQALRTNFSQLSEEGQRATAAQAFLLLSKSLQLIGGLGLTDRELAYLLAQGTTFGGFDLTLLPTSVGADQAAAWATAQVGVRSLVRLLAYRQLKEPLAGERDGLVDLFALADEATMTEFYNRLGKRTRRDPAAVAAAAQALTLQPQHLRDERGIAKLWQFLQLWQRLGTPLTVVQTLPHILVPGLPATEYEAVAQGLKNAVKARYDIDAWQQVAQPIFDKVRQRKRDALVAYLLHTHRHLFRTMEEMYEYFLLDPGMEPVVQTSRVRLATAAVQLFIQRCLLNLETRWTNQVPPSAINAKHWQWMNRYRVWEANRKIFLFPENWLEPEWRDDKSHLFQELEGKLLQGDVTNDLVEEAFFGYLQKLETVARLEMVTMVCEEDELNPQANKLHVIGRTYSTPHQYFYRQYAQQMWTPWAPVGAEIDGDHLVATIWRGRLQLFWVTFMERMPQELPPSGDQSNRVFKSDLNKDAMAAIRNQPAANQGGKKLTELSLTDTKTFVATAAAEKIIEAHLHWSEYYQGQWSTRQSGDMNRPLAAKVAVTTTPRHIVIHLTKEGQNPIDPRLDGAVLIHLIGLGYAFRVVNKNSPPQIVPATPAPTWPYTATPAINRLDGTGSRLEVTFTSYLEKLDGQIKQERRAPQTILGKAYGPIELIPCSDPSSMGGAEIGKLVSPFFFQDSWHTFFVEPTFSETKTIKEWDEWVGGRPTLVKPFTPKIEQIYPRPKPKLGDLLQEELLQFDFDERMTRYQPKVRNDWTTNPATLLTYGDRVIDAIGGLDVVVSAPTLAAPELLRNRDQLNRLIEQGAPDRELLFVRPGGDARTAEGSLVRRLGGDTLAVTPETSVQLVGTAGVAATQLVESGHISEIFNSRLGVIGQLNRRSF